MKESPASEKRLKAYKDGILYERAAEIFLMGKGYTILERRYKTAYGEIDLIARRRDDIVFVEVKGRQSIEEALYSVTPRMRERITQAAVYFTGAFPDYANHAMRFDVIAVKLPFSIEHIENAWMA